MPAATYACPNTSVSKGTEVMVGAHLAHHPRGVQHRAAYSPGVEQELVELVAPVRAQSNRRRVAGQGAFLHMEPQCESRGRGWSTGGATGTGGGGAEAVMYHRCIITRFAPQAPHRNRDQANTR